MRHSLTDALLSQTGKFYLQLRFRNKAKIAHELTIKYEGQYRNVGLMLLFDVFMALAVVVIVGLVAIMLYYTTN
ncbi:hypothetical protein JAO76_11090 [Pontibacter sp. BT310]|uniref:Uncharacterized protein n=1 Tax=Pontibacter populi TaxID=890055 RepID=A0ABS6XC75_9BACT|nr:MULTISPECIES: hypothetical protein [Pontibacter]MBJ6118742.1 hypothetical protein [Pontibacter sp. BT310]MBR0571171.1 hypothetical protein [Microvirga sp. STS03]MBW3365596.1 hypothetical protein [Pontibacter populi]